MENMNLASRCRESISHVAMLKKELALQQKRTAQALASQREQTKRMADSLTNSFLSFSSPESAAGSQHRNSSGKKSSHRSHVGTDEDENLSRLVSSTPSPNRDALHHRPKTRLFDDVHDYERQKDSKPTSQTSTSSRTKKPTGSTEESRDSPATTATTAATSPPSDFEEDEKVLDRMEKVLDRMQLSSSSLSESPDDERNDRIKDKKKQTAPVMYSTPKKSERSKSPSFDVENENGFGDIATEKTELFPVSASPKVFNSTNSNRGNKSYDEGFPSDIVTQPENDSPGKYAKNTRKMNLVNSIDAFEQSFSVDFPDSFTPKESNNITSSPGSKSSQKPYNPFFATPEKQNSRADSRPSQLETTGEPTRVSPTEYRTPPKNLKNAVLAFDKNERDSRPKRPEKTTPSSARARYERVLGQSSTQGKHPASNEAEKKSSGGNSPNPLQRRIQQRKRLDKNLESMSNASSTSKSSAELTSALDQKHQSRKEMSSILDEFENIENGATQAAPQPSSASKFSGPIKSLRRRSVKKPISYAEPPLNTKLRRGDTFFPKTSPNDAQNHAPNVTIQSAVVSP